MHPGETPGLSYSNITFLWPSLATVFKIANPTTCPPYSSRRKKIELRPISCASWDHLVPQFQVQHTPLLSPVSSLAKEGSDSGFWDHWLVNWHLLYNYFKWPTIICFLKLKIVEGIQAHIWVQIIPKVPAASVICVVTLPSLSHNAAVKSLWFVIVGAV